MTPVHNWQRVSPVAIIFFVVNGIPHLVNLWPALVPILAGGEAVRNFAWSYGLYVLAILAVMGSVVPYWFFRYGVASDHIQLRTGVFQRRRLTLYYDRVQQADVAQPFYFRPFGLAVLGLESAGSSQQEVHIPGLRLAQAEELKALILAQGAKAPPFEPTADGTKRTAPSPDYELQLPWHEVARYGLMHNGLLLLFPILGPLMQNWLPGLEEWLKSLEGTPFHQQLLAITNHNTILIAVLFGAFVMMSGLISVYAISVAVALLRYWNYHLTRHGDQYQYRAGLTTLKTRGFRLHKLQLVTLSQGVVARFLRRCTLSISKAGGAGLPAQQEQQRFVVPVVTSRALVALKRQLGLPTPRWVQLHRYDILSSTLAWGTLVSGSIAFALDAAGSNPWFAVVGFPLCGLLAWRRWWCSGFFCNHQWIAVKSGFIGRKVRWLPIAKAQKITLSQPPWLRALGLTNLHIWGAEGRLTLPYLPTKTADRLRDEVLSCVGKFRGKWL